MEDHIEESLSEKIRRMSRTNKWEEFDSEVSDRILFIISINKRILNVLRKCM